MMLCIGLLAAMLMDWALASAGRRWMVGLPAVPGAAMALSLLLLPESPRWLLMQGRMEQALEVLHLTMRKGKVGGGAAVSRHYVCAYRRWDSQRLDAATVATYGDIAQPGIA